jgi:hypothetical protein
MFHAHESKERKKREAKIQKPLESGKNTAPMSAQY